MRRRLKFLGVAIGAGPHKVGFVSIACLAAGDSLRVDVERDADALAPLDGAQHGVDFHVDAGDVIYIPAGYYRGLRAKDASTSLIYGFAPSQRKGRDTDQDDISSPAPHPEDLLDESSSSELGV